MWLEWRGECDKYTGRASEYSRGKRRDECFLGALITELLLLLSCFSHDWLCVTPWIAAPSGSSAQRDSPGKNTGVGCHFLLRDNRARQVQLGSRNSRQEEPRGIFPQVSNSLQYSCLENPMDRGAWQASDHRVARIRHDLVTKPPPTQWVALLKSFTM